MRNHLIYKKLDYLYFSAYHLQVEATEILKYILPFILILNPNPFLVRNMVRGESQITKS